MTGFEQYKERIEYTFKKFLRLLHEGNSEAVEAALFHYAGYIKYVFMMNGRMNADKQ